MISKGKYTHMTLSERILIETELYKGSSFKTIGEKLHRDPSTISKEIQRCMNLASYKQSSVDCVYYKNCRSIRLCKDAMCKDFCKDCPTVDCTTVCKRHKKYFCSKLLKAPYVCNACDGRLACHLEKHYYKATDAQRRYEHMLSDSRKGLNMTKNELDHLNEMVSPLILQGQSLSHIYANHAKEIGVSRQTLYKLIAMGLFKAKTMDLPRKVRYKKRKKKKNESNINYLYRHGRTYLEFCRYMDSNPCIEVVEMDTVKGSRYSGKCFLTLLFRTTNLMLIYLLNSCTEQAVADVFNALETKLGSDLFRQTFPVILTDNGPEFKNPDALETGHDGNARTKIFYCDPMHSNQKAKLERNHEYIRYVIPKGVSLHNLTQEHAALLTDHINSTARDSLNGHTPYELSEILMKKEVLEKLNLHKVSPDNVKLNKTLLK